VGEKKSNTEQEELEYALRENLIRPILIIQSY